ncbi:hypothetical protein GC169_12870 [bacterium]|nr:hypothetical protein [bacterium]
MRSIVVALALLSLPTPAIAQAAEIPRTRDGRPDFQGVWESRWRTPFERQDEAKGDIASAEEVAALIEADKKEQASDGDLHPDEDFDWGPFMPAPGGGYRTSLFVEPYDGKEPLTAEARIHRKALGDLRNGAEGPEARGLMERCVRGPGTAPLRITPGNMHRLIVQTSDHLVINTEDMAEARIIEFAAPRRPTALTSYMGESTGRWDGDTLIVETRLLRHEPITPPAEVGRSDRKVTETFILVAPDVISYGYVIDDRAIYTTPVRADFTLLRSASPMFEASCHEGNYSMAGILGGARVTERREQARKAGRP